MRSLVISLQLRAWACPFYCCTPKLVCYNSPPKGPTIISVYVPAGTFHSKFWRDCFRTG